MTGTPDFHVGNIPVYGEAILSPMDGYSDLPFRLLCRELGSAMSYTEFVNVDELQGRKGGSARARCKLQFDPSEHPTMVYQLYGHDVDRLVETAGRVVAENQPDILDINMGCYVRKISARGAGAGMMCFPERVAELFARLSKTLPVPVTAKIRLGWDDDTRNYLEIARILEDNGAALVAIHGRTRAQAYKGEADWDAIAEVKQALSIPVIGNGDVRTVADVARMKTHTGCDGVMIGRAAIGNPWIFAGKDRHQVSFSDKVAMVRRHLALNLDFYGPERGLTIFRKHLAKYIQGVPGESRIRIPLLTCEHVDDFVRVITEHEMEMGRYGVDEVIPVAG